MDIYYDICLDYASVSSCPIQITLPLYVCRVIVCGAFSFMLIKLLLENRFSKSENYVLSRRFYLFAMASNVFVLIANILPKKSSTLISFTQYLYQCFSPFPFVVFTSRLLVILSLNRPLLTKILRIFSYILCSMFFLLIILIYTSFYLQAKFEFYENVKWQNFAFTIYYIVFVYWLLCIMFFVFTNVIVFVIDRKATRKYFGEKSFKIMNILLFLMACSVFIFIPYAVLVGIFEFFILRYWISLQYEKRRNIGILAQAIGDLFFDLFPLVIMTSSMIVMSRIQYKEYERSDQNNPKLNALHDGLI